MDSIGILDWVAMPVAMATAIVPHPMKPILAGAFMPSFPSLPAARALSKKILSSDGCVVLSERYREY